MLAHVVLLAAIAIAVPIACARTWRRPSVRRVCLALGVAALVAFASLVVGLHFCDRGEPLTQWAVPCLALAFVIAGVGRPALRRGLAAMLALMSIGLSGHFAGTVHRDDVVGSTTADCTTAHRLWHTRITGFYAATKTCDVDERRGGRKTR